jgi:predicted nucleotidyltransferase
VAKGLAGPESDLDLLVDLQAAPSIEQYMDLNLALEGLADQSVDLVTRSGLRPEHCNRIEAEVVLAG